MESKFSPEIVKIYHFRYIREYRAVSVLWAVLTIIWCILNIVCFVQPQWIGDTEESEGYGHMGVYSYCYPDSANSKYICSGTFTDFDTILNGSFKASTFFCGVAALLMLITVAALMLFFCFKKKAVFVFCGILELVCFFKVVLTLPYPVQAEEQYEQYYQDYQGLGEGQNRNPTIIFIYYSTAIFMFLACVIYPSGWTGSRFDELCGRKDKSVNQGEYTIGLCGVRWAYILAIIGIFDAFVLALLAFFLASKRAHIDVYSPNGTVTKSELNGYDTMSKKSIPIQPQVVAVPDTLGEPDRYSEFSRHSEKPRSRGGFQL